MDFPGYVVSPIPGYLGDSDDDTSDILPRHEARWKAARDRPEAGRFDNVGFQPDEPLRDYEEPETTGSNSRYHGAERSNVKRQRPKNSVDPRNIHLHPQRRDLEADVSVVERFESDFHSSSQPTNHRHDDFQSRNKPDGRPTRHSESQDRYHGDDGYPSSHRITVEPDARGLQRGEEYSDSDHRTDFGGHQSGAHQSQDTDHRGGRHHHLSEVEDLDEIDRHEDSVSMSSQKTLDFRPERETSDVRRRRGTIRDEEPLERPKGLPSALPKAKRLTERISEANSSHQVAELLR